MCKLETRRVSEESMCKLETRRVGEDAMRETLALVHDLQHFTLPPGESGSQARRGPSPIEDPPWRATTASDPLASGWVKTHASGYHHMRRIQKTLRTAITLSIIWLPSIASACPTCKDSLHDNGAATGYAISILFMMSMPMLITAFWVVLIWRLRLNINGKPHATTYVTGQTPTPSTSPWTQTPAS